MSTPERRLPGWVLPAGLGLVVVALVALALARGPVEFDSDTPEGAVQEYLMAISDERWDDALEVLHEDWRGSCAGEDLRSFDPGDFSAELGTSGGSFSGVSEERFAVPGSEDEALPTIPEERMTVEVTIRHGGTGGWNEFTTFDVVDQGGFWWLVGDPWPYFAWSCQGR